MKLFILVFLSLRYLCCKCPHRKLKYNVTHYAWSSFHHITIYPLIYLLIYPLISYHKYSRSVITLFTFFFLPPTTQTQSLVSLGHMWTVCASTYMIKKILQLLVCKINAELLESVHGKILKPKDVKNTCNESKQGFG